jgi:hypothetical protein
VFAGHGAVLLDTIPELAMPLVRRWGRWPGGCCLRWH